MNESRRTSLDIMTIIASFLVVLTHQASQVDARSIYVYRIISEAAVPLFIMKSGTLLLSNSKRIDYSYVRKRITKFALIITFLGLVLQFAMQCSNRWDFIFCCLEINSGSCYSGHSIQLSVLVFIYALGALHNFPCNQKIHR